MSTDPTALDQTIIDAAQGPAEAVVDGQSAKQHPLPDLIAMDKYIAAKAVKKSPFSALRFARMVPGGVVSDRRGQ